MSLKIEVKANIHGRRKLLFERIKNKTDISKAALIRKMIDFYIDSHPEEAGIENKSVKLYSKTPPRLE